jgi:hypothetical protein
MLFVSVILLKAAGCLYWSSSIRFGIDVSCNLNGRRKLREISEYSRVYITANEPPEARTFEHLKAKAEREHKAVSVSSDVLSVDGIELFSLSNGFFNSSQSSDQRAVNVYAVLSRQSTCQIWRS